MVFSFACAFCFKLLCSLSRSANKCQKKPQKSTVCFLSFCCNQTSHQLDSVLPITCLCDSYDTQNWALFIVQVRSVLCVGNHLHVKIKRQCLLSEAFRLFLYFRVIFRKSWYKNYVTLLDFVSSSLLLCLPFKRSHFHIFIQFWVSYETQRHVMGNTETNWWEIWLQ